MALVITDTGSAGFLVVLPVLHIKTIFTAVNIRFLSTRFLVALIITEFLLHVKAILIITGPRLLSTGLLIVMVIGFPSANVIGIGLGAEFLVMLIILLNTMFLSLVKVALTGKNTTACAEPLILLCLDTAVFLDIDQAIVKVIL
jgi:hypothetical protein